MGDFLHYLFYADKNHNSVKSVEKSENNSGKTEESNSCDQESVEKSEINFGKTEESDSCDQESVEKSENNSGKTEESNSCHQESDNPLSNPLIPDADSVSDTRSVIESSVHISNEITCDISDIESDKSENISNCEKISSVTLKTENLDQKNNSNCFSNENSDIAPGDLACKTTELAVDQSEEFLSLFRVKVVQESKTMNSDGTKTETDVDSGRKTDTGLLLSHDRAAMSDPRLRSADKGESPVFVKSPEVRENAGDDNVELFTPMKALNFTDATDSDAQQNDGIEDEDDGFSSIETARQKPDFNPTTNNQGIRIIEGHASPLDDTTGQQFSFQNNTSGYLTAQDNNADMFSESPNLYDSLEEHEDGDVSRERKKRSPLQNRYKQGEDHHSSPSHLSGHQRQFAGESPQKRVGVHSNFRNNSSPVSPHQSSSRPDLEFSPGEILTETEMIERSGDTFQWNLPTSLMHLTNVSSMLGTFPAEKGDNSGLSVDDGYHVSHEERYMPHGDQNPSPERRLPAGTQDVNEDGLKTTGAELILPNAQSGNSSALEDEYDREDSAEDVASGENLDNQPQVPRSTGNMEKRDKENQNPSHQDYLQGHLMNKIPDINIKRSTSHPQKPTRQNLIQQNQKVTQGAEANPICSKQAKHEHRQNVSNNSAGSFGGGNTKARTGNSVNKVNPSRQTTSHPRTRPNAQGGNVQERQRAPFGSSQGLQTSQRQRQNQTTTTNSGRPQTARGVRDDKTPPNRHSRNMNYGTHLTGNDNQYENRIAGVGQDDIISRSDFTGLPDPEDAHSYPVFPRSGRGQQREATVGYQNNDQYVSMMGGSDVGSVEDINSDVRYSPRSSVTNDRDRGRLISGQQNLPRSPQSSSQAGAMALSVDIMGMEEVRSHLHSMLRGETNNYQGPPSVDASVSPTDLLMDHGGNRHRNTETSSIISHGAKLQDDVPDIFENFPSFSSKIFTSDMNGSNNRVESSIQNENQYLRDALERERYRRKHCEEQIQHLNSKLLETQQQLAVAISRDKKKDVMIEQLDKQLARVVEGWKKREAEKDDNMKILTKEKSKLEEKLQKQQVMISSFEKNMGDALEELRKAKMLHVTDVEQLEHQLKESERVRKLMKEELEGEKERVGLIHLEHDQLKESRELAEKRAQVAQDRLHHEQDEFYKREQELLSKIDEVKDANLKVIHMERRKTEEEQTRIVELEEKLRRVSTEKQKLDLDLDAVKREKESLKVEMSIMEVKYENNARKLEADLQTQMEKAIAEQIEDVTAKMETTVSEIQDRHRLQVMELQKRQQEDLEKQLHEFHEQVVEKEEELRQQIVEGENQLREYRKENTSLKSIKQKLESQRMEILTKLQFMMQSQWNEAVSLLVNTPHRRRQMSAVSSINPSQPDLMNPTLNLSLMTQSVPKTSSPGHDGHVTNFGLYVEEEGGVSHVDGSRAPPTQTARVEAYLSSLPNVQQNQRPSAQPPSSTDHLFKHTYPNHPSSLPSSPHMSVNLQTEQLTIRSDPPLPAGSSHFTMQSNNTSSSMKAHPTGLPFNSNPSYHTGTTSNKSSKNTFSPSSQRVGSSHLADNNSNNIKKDLNSHESVNANQSLLSDVYHSADNFSHVMQSFGSPKSQGGYGHHPNLNPNLRSPGQLVRPRSMENSPVNKLRTQFVRSATSPDSFNHGYHRDPRSRPPDTSMEDPDVLMIDTFYHANLPTDSQLHHMLNQRIEAYLTNRNASDTADHASAVMIRPPHQQNRSMNGQELYQPANREESGERRRQHSGLTEDEGGDMASTAGSEREGQLTLQDLSSYSPPVKQDRGQSEEGDSTLLDTVRLKNDYGQLSSQVEEHQNRQTELQHYIKKLLDKSPGSCKEEKLHDKRSDGDNDTSREINVDFGLDDTDQAAQMHEEFSRLQLLREKQTITRKVKDSQGHDVVADSEASLPGVIPPEQMLEISQLLTQYQEQLNEHQVNQKHPAVNQTSGTAASTVSASTTLTSLLVTALQNLPSRPPGTKEGKVKPNVKFSPKSSQTRKQKETQKTTHHGRESTPASEGGAEKVGVAKKPDKKTVAVKPSQHKGKFWK